MEYPGFTSEKLSHGFEFYSVPIYLGDPLVGKIYNSKAFVNCADFNNDFSAVVERVREIDENDNLYIDMLCQPITHDPDFCHHQFEKLQSFLYNICDQAPDKAYRRPRYYCAGRYEAYEKEYAAWVDSFSYRLYKKYSSLK